MMLYVQVVIGILGHEYLISLEERLTQSSRDTIKTGWDTIDEVMDGGLAGGELGVIVAPGYW